MKKTLLWVGDAVCSSGFARNTHKVLDVLRHEYDVVVLGLNSFGTPHEYPYEIWPCYPGGDMFGVGRLTELVKKRNPHVIVIQNDSWNFPEYMQALVRVTSAPVVGIVAVDGYNVQGYHLDRLATAVFWTRFAEREARRGGYQGRSHVVPLGVDTELYRPMDRTEARLLSGIPASLRDVFIVGNINRNQPRKRMDLFVSYFAEWITTHKIPDAYAYVHYAPTGDEVFDLGQLMGYYGFAGDKLRLLTSETEIFNGLPEAKVARLYSAFDVMMTTTQGEGWGLTTMEGMACGVPQIVPKWSALGEWTEDAVVQVPCAEIAVTPTMQRGGTRKINIIGGVMHRAGAITALDQLYRDAVLRKSLGRRGMELVSRPEYQWQYIGKQMLDIVATVLPVRESVLA